MGPPDMARSLPDKDIRAVQKIMDDASCILTEAQKMCSRRSVGPELRELVVNQRARMCQLLAYFEEGKGFGLVEPEVTMAMRGYEGIADGLVEAIDKMGAAHDAERVCAESR